ncbi:iron export ABC transporter permease subunit FetB [Anaerolineales bacterium HSG24]|nr:iron export ABC transporter permease subunit FetB [Anaerolineales bacterium HSG24]
MFDTLAWLPRILGALVLVGVAMGLSRWQRVELEKEMLIAVGRAFIQLIAIGYALDLIFSSAHPLWIGLVVAIMVTIAGYTAGQRGRQIPHSQLIATSAVAVSALVVLSSLILLQVFPFEPRYIIPIAGMVIGNSMTAAGLTMARLRDDIRSQQDKIEAALALGATQRQAGQIYLRRALRMGMTPIVDNTKTVGLISLPGAMTGMILAGASPLEAVQLQIIVMYMLIGAAAFSSLTATFLTYRQFFSRAHQLRENVGREG